MIPADRIAAIRSEYDHCFGCGRSNPIGHQLDSFALDNTCVTADFLPRSDYHGFADLLHGGIVAAALDEIMAWTAILTSEVMVMTGTLELRYRKPAPVEAEYQLRGELLERSGRRLRLRGTMNNRETTVAEASGLFLVVHELGVSAPNSRLPGE